MYPKRTKTSVYITLNYERISYINQNLISMKNYYAFFIIFSVTFSVCSQSDSEKYLKQKIEEKASTLDSLNKNKGILKEIRSSLGNVLKNIKEKKDIDQRIEKCDSLIQIKKIELYELRTQLPANNPNAISVKLDNKDIDQKINLYASLIKETKEQQSNLKDENGNISNEKLFNELEQIIIKYTNDKNELEDKLKDHKIAIFEQAERLKNSELPFNLSPDEQASIKKDPLLWQKHEINDKYQRLLINDKSKIAFANAKTISKATILNTNFTVPIARFNFQDQDNAEGNVILFNSIGAGIGLSWGRMEEIRNGTGDVVSTNFRNTINVHAGVLFSASSGGEGDNVFAPMISLGGLDFQLGLGYELGTLAENQKRLFLTVGYAIPLHKLTKTKFYVIKKSKILNEIITF